MLGRRFLLRILTFQGNYFLKHLMVSSDLGGEALNKLPPLSNYFDDGVMEFLWNGEIWCYEFAEIQGKCALTNSALRVDSKGLLKGRELTARMLDVIYLILLELSQPGIDCQLM